MLATILLIFPALTQAPGQEPVYEDTVLKLPHAFDYKEILAELSDFRRLTQLPLPGERGLQFSSWDRASGAGPAAAEAWYANQDSGQFLREETGASGATEYVLVETDGPGWTTRIWAAEPSGDLLFYVDGAAEPALRIPFQDLCSGATAPFFAPLSGVSGGGWNCYVPLPFQERLKVTSTAADLTYQINVRLLPPSCSVPSLSAALLAANAAELKLTAEIVGDVRLSPPVDRASMTAGTITARRPMKMEFRSFGTLRAFDLWIKNWSQLQDPDAALRAVRIQVTLDGAAEPQIDVPLSEFFGAGPSAIPYAGYAFGVRSAGAFYCRLPMPFTDGMLIKLVSDGGEPLVVRAEMAVDVTVSGPLRLHAAYHQSGPLATQPRSDYRVLQAEGPGRFVGCALTVLNPTRTWWGEGDEKVYVDDEAFPSTFGTGTGDYFGYAAGSNEIFSHPFHSQVRCDGPGNHGYTTVNRFQLADHVPFQKDFRFDFEVWHPEDVQVEFRSTAWWYAPAAAGDGMPALPSHADREPAPAPALAVFRVPGVIEAERLRPMLQAGLGRIRNQDMGGFGKDWSGEQQLWWTGGTPGATLTLPFRVANAGEQRLLARFTKTPGSARVALYLDGAQVRASYDLYADDVVADAPLDLGVHDLSAGAHMFNVHILGANDAAAPTFMVGLDYLALEPATTSLKAPESLHSLSAPALEGGSVSLQDFAGQAVLVVNVASECGYTPQYAGLQQLHEKLSGRGFAVLGFPSNEFGGQEPGDAAQIREFCDSKYGIGFPLFAKVEVKPGAGQSPVYEFLTRGGDVPNWNFCKYLIGKDGTVLGFYPSKIAPDDPGLLADIEKALAAD
ncbi:MAG TPA: DUF2961 domain-containing protein [Planctomycetota bacterium]